MPFCQAHGIRMLPSKFGEGKYWCPKCAEEKRALKQPQGFQKAVEPLDQPATKKDLAVVRGDLKRIMDILAELEKKSVIYPQEKENTTFEIPEGEPPEESEEL